MSSNPATPTPVVVTLALLFSSSVGFAADTHGARSGDSFHWISPIGGAFAAPRDWNGEFPRLGGCSISRSTRPVTLLRLLTYG